MDLSLNLYKDKKGIFYGTSEEQKKDLFTIVDAIEGNQVGLEALEGDIRILAQKTSGLHKEVQELTRKVNILSESVSSSHLGILQKLAGLERKIFHTQVIAGIAIVISFIALVVTLT